ncbi:hypothetical protein [Nocardia salmonicida]|uniref:hypothetical protein n=1 Tax=Nocardia salmonicida TaxID=53431 RepID=UPI0034019C6B
MTYLLSCCKGSVVAAQDRLAEKFKVGRPGLVAVRNRDRGNWMFLHDEIRYRICDHLREPMLTRASTISMLASMRAPVESLTAQREAAFSAAGRRPCSYVALSAGAHVHR